MKKVDDFTNLYPLSKTLRFRLIPEGNTLQKMEEASILEKDEQIACDYQTIKKVVDNYYKSFIEKALKIDLSTSDGWKGLTGLENFYVAYINKDSKVIDDSKNEMKKQIEDRFTSQKEYKTLFDGKLIKNFNHNNDEKLTEEEKEAFGRFGRFSSYLTGFFNNRENIFTNKNKTTEVINRLIEENMAIFVRNISIYSSDLLKYKEMFTVNDFSKLKEKLNYDGDLSSIFEIQYYNKILTQSGIDRYNQILGGFSEENGNKIKGINEYINEYDQKNKDKIPQFRPLHKQILSDRSSLSFLPRQFESDDELFKAINNQSEMMFSECMGVISDSINGLVKADLSKIYIDAKQISNLSNSIYNNWSLLGQYFENDYASKHPNKKSSDIEKWEEKKNKYFNSLHSYSISDLQKSIEYIQNEDPSYKLFSLVDYFITDKYGTLYDSIKEKYIKYKEVSLKYTEAKNNLIQNSEDIQIVKQYLDSIKEMQFFLKLFVEEENKDIDLLFYSSFSEARDKFDLISPVYNKCRDYLTGKPYSLEKNKLNFETPTFLNGWDVNKEKDNLGIILRRGKDYFLGVMDKSYNKVFSKIPIIKDGEDTYEKMYYKLVPDPKKTLPRVSFPKNSPPVVKQSDEIKRICSGDTFKLCNNFNIDDCHKLIDYYKETILKYPGWEVFDFKFSDTNNYKNMNDFFDEVHDQGYNVYFKKVSKEYIDSLVNEGKLYLFRLYNKDFSSYSHGNKNLHTMYFESIFDENNLKDVVYTLSGGAEMFYRKKSIISKEITHPKNIPIHNKNYEFNNSLSKKETSIFEYDLIKNRRFTMDQFFLHCPISMNFKSEGINSKKFNNLVRERIKKCANNYIIGIDRGERNLLYLSVIDENGKIIEQYSPNIIGNIDYHEMLESREKERINSHKSWSSVDDIKNMKEGYLSFVIRQIVDLMIKYDAIVAMEDLNFGFKKSRIKFERAVYQKFEKALIDKTNYLVNKGTPSNEKGGLYHAYQLTPKFETFNKLSKQTGFIFYVPAWLTSKIDPVTGFANQFYTSYTSLAASQKFISHFKSIKYDPKENLFSFDFRYSDFQNGTNDFQDDWTVYSYGTRIKKLKNSLGIYTSEEININDEFINLFKKYKIDYTFENLKELIINSKSVDFFKNFYYLFNLMLQLRNTDDKNDYIISPVKDSKTGKFFDSRNYLPDTNPTLPRDADANGAYNIAKKALMMVKRIKESVDVETTNLIIKNKEWLEYEQKK